MDQRARLIKDIEDAERELDAATRLRDVNRAAKKLQQARAELKRLHAKEKGAEQR